MPQTVIAGIGHYVPQRVTHPVGEYLSFYVKKRLKTDAIQIESDKKCLKQT